MEIAGSVAGVAGVGVVGAAVPPVVAGEVVDVPVPPVVVPVAPLVAGAGALAATAAQPVPGFTPVRTFDQTIVLSLNARLVPSSNS
ncbi:MAG: hypothetical protein EXQ81_08760 [Thermoleophilia bacterium]|nr:hypothetical protein [Thermoleophilia bacterium]